MNSSEEQEYIKIAKDCITECEPEKLISESKFLTRDSLEELLTVRFFIRYLLNMAAV